MTAEYFGVPDSFLLSVAPLPPPPARTLHAYRGKAEEEEGQPSYPSPQVARCDDPFTGKPPSRNHCTGGAEPASPRRQPVLQGMKRDKREINGDPLWGRHSARAGASSCSPVSQQKVCPSLQQRKRALVILGIFFSFWKPLLMVINVATKWAIKG